MNKVLKTTGIDLFAYSVLGSTNDEAKRLAGQGTRGPLVIWATRQARGRGRARKNWIGMPGNLMASLLLHPGRVLAEAGSMALVAGLAVTDYARTLGVDARIKWPNDVLVGDAKLAGVLVEASSGNDELNWMVIGIGLNLAVAPVLGRQTACIGHEVKLEVALDQVIEFVLRRYRQWLCGGFLVLRDEWLERAAWLGRSVRIGNRLGAVEGTIHTVDANGALIVCDSAGVEHCLFAGEIVPLEVQCC